MHGWALGYGWALEGTVAHQQEPVSTRQGTLGRKHQQAPMDINRTRQVTENQSYIHSKIKGLSLEFKCYSYSCRIEPAIHIPFQGPPQH